MYSLVACCPDFIGAAVELLMRVKLFPLRCCHATVNALRHATGACAMYVLGCELETKSNLIQRRMRCASTSSWKSRG